MRSEPRRPCNRLTVENGIPHPPQIRIRTVNESKLRWGILGTAQIARKNWKAIQLAGNSTVTAVASRDLERSRRFIAECQAEAPMEVDAKPFGSYADLLGQAEVDAVYVPLPTGQ